MASSDIKFPFDTPLLASQELQVWQFQLDVLAEEQSALTRFLSPDELERADRFQFERDRGRFVTGRGMLRCILGRYLGRVPEEIAFVYGLRGKPALPEAPLQFNMAHSDNLAVVAVTRSRAVGIDVERIREVPDWDDIVKSFFSVAERAAIEVLPAADQLSAFFTCWTRKEAYLKATGDGLAVELGNFDVTVSPGSLPRLLRVEGMPNEVTRWCFHELPVALGFMGVVAVECPVVGNDVCVEAVDTRASLPRITDFAPWTLAFEWPFDFKPRGDSSLLNQLRLLSIQ